MNNMRTMKFVATLLVVIYYVDGQLLLPPSIRNVAQRFGGNVGPSGFGVRGGIGGLEGSLNIGGASGEGGSLDVGAGGGKHEVLEESLEQQFGNFKQLFNKVYGSVEEELHRKEIFIENLSKIKRTNDEYAQGLRGFVAKINPFADLTFHEFFNQLNGFNRSSHNARNREMKPTTFIPPANVIFPETVDWREVGAVGAVQYQGKCAGCWAFAAAGALEGHHYRKTGQLVDVSEQNLIDCTLPYGNSGCNGGLMTPAYEYVRDNDGVDSEQSYPYEERTGECRFKRENVVLTCTGYVEIPVGDERALEIAVGTIGPVSVGIDAGKATFQFYSDGIYDEQTCNNGADDVNHAVLVVGYGREADGRQYWIVKNSYGPQWGIGGYMKLAKNAGNRCGIASKASYPLV
uniref:Cathepsin L15 n=1 Tax=Zabrotes subfasciatus TaxID=122865 RepID=A0A8K1XWM5_ZABSU|nr:cathepsin L15 [Zabrotes subfasciatus]